MKSAIVSMLMILSNMIVLAGIKIPGGVPPGALTVCSEGCDYTTIQDAVEAVEDGGTILLGPETFLESVGITGDRSVTLRGMGPERTIVDGGMVSGTIWLSAQAVTLADLTVKGGYEKYHGGGIIAFYMEELRLENCVIRDNVACTSDVAIGLYGGGMLAVGIDRITVIDSTVQENRCRYGGGGMYLANTGEVLVENSTIADNDNIGILVTQGSPFDNRDTVITVENSTVSGGEWGVHAHGATLNLSHSIVTGGTREALSLSNGTLNSTHSVVSGPGLEGPNCSYTSTTVDSLGHNIDGDGTCGFDHPTDLASVDPMLLPLGDYGGPTLTHALHPESPAIDAGDQICLPLDQRGVPRPFDGDFDGETACDIGPFEFGIHGDVNVVGMLHELVFSMQGGDHDLVEHLQSALLVLSDADQSNDTDALREVLAFIGEVESRRGFTTEEEEAERLVRSAWGIVSGMYGGG